LPPTTAAMCRTCGLSIMWAGRRGRLARAHKSVDGLSELDEVVANYRGFCSFRCELEFKAELQELKKGRDTLRAIRKLISNPGACSAARNIIRGNSNEQSTAGS
jgi:endogenous inhibitor of DNA gyrase (YacG/DUF329 family)